MNQNKNKLEPEKKEAVKVDPSKLPQFTLLSNKEGTFHMIVPNYLLPTIPGAISK